jgi:UDP-glucose 4-epimerase
MMADYFVIIDSETINNPMAYYQNNIMLPIIEVTRNIDHNSILELFF